MLHRPTLQKHASATFVLLHCLAIEKHAGPTFDTDPSIKLHHNQVLNIASQGAQSNVQSWV